MSIREVIDPLLSAADLGRSFDEIKAGDVLDPSILDDLVKASTNLNELIAGAARRIIADLLAYPMQIECKSMIWGGERAVVTSVTPKLHPRVAEQIAEATGEPLSDVQMAQLSIHVSGPDPVSYDFAGQLHMICLAACIGVFGRGQIDRALLVSSTASLDERESDNRPLSQMFADPEIAASFEARFRAIKTAVLAIDRAAPLYGSSFVINPT